MRNYTTGGEDLEIATFDHVDKLEYARRQRLLCYVHESPVGVVDGWIVSSHPDVTEDNCTVQLVLSRDVSSATWQPFNLSRI